jgi:excisionase family DNA binding protein
MGSSNLSIHPSVKRLMLRHWCIESSGPFEREEAKSSICAVKHTGAAAAAASGTVFLTRSEVSKLLGVSPNTVTRWAREGRLPCQVTLGGHHRFDRELVEQLRKSLYRTGSRLD